MSRRADALAQRILEGGEALASFCEGLSDDQWTSVVPPDGRAVGVIAHHVASVYGLEVDLARSIAGGNAIEGVSWDAVAEMNAEHAGEHAEPDREQTIAMLRQNCRTAADAVREFTDDELDTAVTVSLNANAPLTAQFFIEDHALRHSFHHLEKIRTALGV